MGANESSPAGPRARIYLLWCNTRLYLVPNFTFPQFKWFGKSVMRQACPQSKFMKPWRRNEWYADLRCTQKWSGIPIGSDLPVPNYKENVERIGTWFAGIGCTLLQRWSECVCEREREREREREKERVRARDVCMCKLDWVSVLRVAILLVVTLGTFHW